MRESITGGGVFAVSWFLLLLVLAAGILAAPARWATKRCKLGRPSTLGWIPPANLQ
jgi:hypothetical protein